MARRCAFLLVLLGILLLSACQRAQRYKPVAKQKIDIGAENGLADKGLYRLSWTEPRGTPIDVPIVFIPDTSSEWPTLKGYWNALPFPGGMPTVHFGLGPVEAAAALVLVEHHTVVKIRLPRGLPDPTEHFPKTNLPTVGKWRLGKALFHERLLQAGSNYFSCASCHKPQLGFTDGRRTPDDARLNTLSLVNVAYNRRQFWDGRVETLEETLVRGLTEKRDVTSEQSKERALGQHNWGGFVRALVDLKTYNEEFKRVFGVDEHPTQDSVAQALATYMRTILSGDSLVDRAELLRKGKTLTAEHFLEPLQDEAYMFSLLSEVEEKVSREQLAAMLVKGSELFHDKGCIKCHGGALYTDGDFHNVGYAGDEGDPEEPGKETGRAVHVPIGRKESRLVGAYRTPSLRNLAKTGPYFHNGSLFSLAEVVEFYDRKVLPSSHLAKTLRLGNEPRQLNLNKAEKESLVLFLRALEGTPVDPMVVGAAK